MAGEKRLIEEVKVLAEGLDRMLPHLLQPLTSSCLEDVRKMFERSEADEEMKRNREQARGGCELSPTDTSSLMWAPSSTGVLKINTAVRLTSLTSPPDLDSSLLFSPSRPPFSLSLSKLSLFHSSLLLPLSPSVQMFGPAAAADAVRERTWGYAVGIFSVDWNADPRSISIRGDTFV